MRINVHAGHNPDGKVACGAIGFIRESTEARRVKDAVISQLRQLGHTVYDCTCESGSSQSDVLAKIVNACNAHAVDLDVSIHFNSGAKDSSGNGKTTGVEVLVYDTSGRAMQAAGRVCACIASLGFRDRGVKVNKGLYFLKKTKAPAILIECCFVDDKDDVQLYDCQKMAEAIVYGLTGQRVHAAVENASVKREMKTGQAGIGLIKQFEGCRLEAYKCPAGVWTIGYGHTAGVRQGQRITAAQAEAYLRADLEKYEEKVDKCGSYGWNQNEFDALVSFAYNVGSIDGLTANGIRSRAEIADKMLSYNKAAGKVLEGLTRRRQAERQLFLKSCTGATGDTGAGDMAVSTRATVQSGSRGADVTYLQQRLTALGYKPGAADGIFGGKTLEAVKEFQKDRKLAVDGIVGAKTWAALAE